MAEDFQDFRAVPSPATQSTPDHAHIGNVENTSDTHSEESDRDRTQPTA